jgi:iron complex transport system ATP-binding protein
MLKVVNGKIAYGEHVVVDGANLEVLPSKLTIIIGPNAAGKTSLINVLAGNRKLASGDYESSYRKSILIPQSPFYPENITLFEYVSSIFYEKGLKWSLSKEEKQKTTDVLEKLNLQDKASNYMNSLSGGELQLANIALCLMSGADLILLDEPSASLDLINQVMVLDILKKLNARGITIIAIMHDINLACKYGDKFIIISRKGKLIYGDKSNIICKESLCEFYNVDFKVINIDNDIFIQPDI